MVGHTVPHSLVCCVQLARDKDTLQADLQLAMVGRSALDAQLSELKAVHAAHCSELEDKMEVLQSDSLCKTDTMEAMRAGAFGFLVLSLLLRKRLMTPCQFAWSV